MREVVRDRTLTRKFQGQLASYGIPFYWLNDVSHEDPDFEAIQVLTAAGIMPTENDQSLNFNPQGTVSRAVVAIALVNVLGLELTRPVQSTFRDVSPEYFAHASIETLFAQGIVRGIGRRRFGPELSATQKQLAIMLGKAISASPAQFFAALPRSHQPLNRRELARVLYRVLKMQGDRLS
jgi:hypothetical protein